MIPSRVKTEASIAGRKALTTIELAPDLVKLYAKTTAEHHRLRAIELLMNNLYPEAIFHASLAQAKEDERDA